jgi:ligand-binding sensor domain-containing protein
MTGLDRIDPRTDVIRHYVLKSRYLSEEGNGYIYSIFQDKKDSIWVVSDGGLFRLHAQTGGYQQIKEKSTKGNGIFDSHTGYKGSYVTDEGIWIYTISGMVFYEYASGTFYNKYNNPQNKKVFNLDAGSKIGANGEMCTDKKGNLFFIARDSVLIRYNIKTESNAVMRLPAIIKTISGLVTGTAASWCSTRPHPVLCPCALKVSTA